MPRKLSEFAGGHRMKVARGVGNAWDGLLALVMRHIAAASEIDAIQLQILTGMTGTQFGPVAALVERMQPTTTGREKAFRAVLERGLDAPDAHLARLAWRHAATPVVKVRDWFAHAIWATSVLPELKESLIFIQASAVLEHDAQQRDAIIAGRAEAERRGHESGTYMIALPPFDETKAWAFDAAELNALAGEAHRGAFLADMILDAVTQARDARAPISPLLRRALARFAHDGSRSDAAGAPAAVVGADFVGARPQCVVRGAPRGANRAAFSRRGRTVGRGRTSLTDERRST